MIYSKRSILTLFITALSIAGCTTSQKQLSPEEASKELNKIVDAYFESYLKLDPLFATSIGDHRYDDRLTIPISASFRQKQKELTEKGLLEVKKIPKEKLSGQDLLTYEVFFRDLEVSKEMQKVDLSYLMPFDQFNSFPSSFAEYASGDSIITFNTALDYENFLKRASFVPEYIDVMIQNMKEGVKKNITAPHLLVEIGLKQLKDLLVSDYKQSVFYKPLLSLDQKVEEHRRSEIRQAYEKLIETKIYPAYQKLEAFINSSYLPYARKTDGLSSIPGGESYYKALIRAYTTTDLSPKEIQQLGYKEVERIEKEFEEVKKQLGFKGSLRDFFNSLREETPTLYPFTSSEQILSRYQEIYHQVMKEVPNHFHLMPKAAFEIREVPSFKAASSSEAYQNPSEDGSRPGIFWVPIPDPKKYSVKKMEAIFLHEAIPGHHFQLSIQQELTNIPRYRKFGGNTAYIEGWALYAESLGKELGVYKDPYQWIGRLSMEMHRAVRLVVDTGIHWSGWDHEKAIAYSLEHEPGDLAGITSEVERYMAIPAQALSYKIGELNIQKLKKLMQLKLQGFYQEKEFHDLILEDGALPLSVLDAKIERWIETHQTEKP
jgi:uncharacterized protein (DUF885 family)